MSVGKSLTWPEVGSFLERCPALLYCRQGGAPWAVTFVGPNSARLLGYAVTDWLGSPDFWLERVHPEDRARVLAGLDGLRDGGALTQEYRFRDRAGEFRRVRDDVQLLPAAAGCPRTLVGCLTVLCAATDESGEVPDRLLIAHRLAAVGTVAAGVAHEMGNQLPFVLVVLKHAVGEIDAVLHGLGARAGAARGAESGPLLLARLAHAQEELVEALAALEHVRQLVRDVATVARPTAAVAEWEPIEVGPCVEAALRVAGNEIRRHARLVVDGRTTTLVRAPAGLLCQVFVNLLLNAAQSIPDGMAAQSEIRVATRAEDGRVTVAFHDTGCGIEPEHRARIFGPFFTTKPLGAGTGLGLFISRQIVAAVGGAIDFDSVPGEGSVFRVVLPAAFQPSRPQA